MVLEGQRVMRTLHATLLAMGLELGPGVPQVPSSQSGVMRDHDMS